MEAEYTATDTAILVAQNAVYGGAWIGAFILLLYSNVFSIGQVRAKNTWLGFLRTLSPFGLFILTFVQRFGLGYFTSYSDSSITISFYYWLVTSISFVITAFDIAHACNTGIAFSLYHGGIAGGFGMFLMLALLKTEFVIPFSIIAAVFGLIYLANAFLVVRTLNELVVEADDKKRIKPVQRNVSLAILFIFSAVPLAYIIPWALEPAIGAKATNDNVTVGYLVLDAARLIAIPAALWIIFDRPTGKSKSGYKVVKMTNAGYGIMNKVA